MYGINDYVKKIIHKWLSNYTVLGNSPKAFSRTELSQSFTPVRQDQQPNLNSSRWCVSKSPII